MKINSTHPGQMQVDELVREFIELDQFAHEVEERRSVIHKRLCNMLLPNEQHLLDGLYVIENHDGEKIKYTAVSVLPDSRSQAGTDSATVKAAKG